MDAWGQGVRRISFVSSNYCTSPVWSPRGDQIAFVCQADGGHQIYVIAPDGSGAKQLTHGKRNEDPSWSPDGRYLVFATTAFGNNYDLALMLADGSNSRRLTSGVGDDTDPAWSPLVP
jgi:TolB protein